MAFDEDLMGIDGVLYDGTEWGLMNGVWMGFKNQ